MSTESKYWWTSSSGRIEFQLDREVIKACSHPGPCDADVEYFQPLLNLNLDRETMINELSEYGAWSEEELDLLTNNELEQKILWIACGDIQDDPDHEFNNGED